MEPSLGPPADAASAADPELFRFIRDRDVDCPGCGYNLRSLTSGRCPECGEELTLGLQLVEPRQAAPIAGLIGLASGLGLAGLLLIFAAIVTILMRRGGDLGEFVLINSVGFLIHGAAVLLWVRNWKRIRRMKSATRWLLVAAAWAMPLIFVVVFSVFVQ
jgi:hypothetical protein